MIIIPAAVLAAPAVCHVLCKRQEEEKRKASKKSGAVSVTKSNRDHSDKEE